MGGPEDLVSHVKEEIIEPVDDLEETPAADRQDLMMTPEQYQLVATDEEDEVPAADSTNVLAADELVTEAHRADPPAEVEVRL